MQLFFLVHLSNGEPRKNKGNPSLEQIQSEMFYQALIKLENNYQNYENNFKIDKKNSVDL